MYLFITNNAPVVKSGRKQRSFKPMGESPTQVQILPGVPISIYPGMFQGWRYRLQNEMW